MDMYYSYLPYNQHDPFHICSFVGLISVTTIMSGLISIVSHLALSSPNLLDSHGESEFVNKT